MKWSVRTGINIEQWSSSGHLYVDRGMFSVTLMHRSRLNELPDMLMKIAALLFVNYLGMAIMGLHSCYGRYLHNYDSRL